MAEPIVVLAGGAALLLLMGGKKRRRGTGKKGNGTTNGGTTNGGVDQGGQLDDPLGKKKPGGGSQSGGGSKSGGTTKTGGPPANLAPDAVWVSPDCKEVVFGDDTGEDWWERRGMPVAQKFIEANYTDPYEIARAMIHSMAPCAIEFPVAEDNLELFDEEYNREMFLRRFPGPYYLIQFIYNRVATMLGQENYTIDFDENCDVVFVGDNWINPVARRMARFYYAYMYPDTHKLPQDEHRKKYRAWEGADVNEKYMNLQDNVATAVINRVSPECGKNLAEAFKKESPGSSVWYPSNYLSTRPGLDALLGRLIAEIYKVGDELMFESVGDGIDFEMIDPDTYS